MELIGRDHQLVLSNEMIVEVTRVLRYPRLQEMYRLTDADLLEYTQFLQSFASLVTLDSGYAAPLRDPADLVVLQTAERGEADILCTTDGDFHDPVVAAFCAQRGIEVCGELSLLDRLISEPASQ